MIRTRADPYRLIASSNALESARSETFQVYAVTGGAAQLVGLLVFMFLFEGPLSGCERLHLVTAM